MTHTQRKLHAITVMIIAVCLLLSSCGGVGVVTQTPVPPTPAPPTVEPVKEWSPANLLPIIETASRLEPKEPVNEVVEEITEEGDFKYIQEKHNVIQNRESVLFLGQNDDVLYPGAIIQGKDVYDFVYKPIITARAPIRLSLPFEGVPSTGESITITVEDPSKLSNVRQGINDLLKMAITPETKVPAKFDYVSEQVFTSAEKNLTLGVSGSYADVSVGYDFDWKSEEYRNKILSIYKQVYYTVDVDLPAAPYDLFDPAAGVASLAAALPPGSMPMYVSSVSYGWMALLFIETNYSKDQMDMALDVAYDPAGDLEAKMDFGYSAKNVLQTSKIQIIVYGGSTSGLTSDTLKGYTGLLELIQGSKNFGTDSPAVPLSFRLRHLTNNLIAKIALTEEYTVTKAVRLREFVKISVDKFACVYDDDSRGALDMDRFHLWVTVYQGDTVILNQPVVWYENGDIGMRAGTNWVPANKAAAVVMLDMKHFDPGAYTIKLTADARDNDDFWEGGSDDWAFGSTSISGDRMYEKPVNFFEIVEASNMKFEVFYTIQPTTKEDCETYKPCNEQLAQWIVTPTPKPTPKP